MAKKKNKKQPSISDLVSEIPMSALMGMMGMRPQITVDMVAESAQESMPEHVSAIWRVQSEQKCCNGTERDGIIITVPSKKQLERKLEIGNGDPRRAHVICVAVSEHSGEHVHLNFDAEMLKKLHNILPQVIAAAEFQRDEAARTGAANDL